MSKSEEEKLHNFNEDVEEKRVKRFSFNERMMQVLFTLAFKGPLNVREISQEIAKYTGESPESVRVVIYRRFNNLIRFRLIEKVGKKKVDITPFAALLLAFASPSILLRLAVLHSLERRYPNLLKNIAVVVAACNFGDVYFERKDEYARVYIDLYRKTASFEENLEFILNDEELGKVDFSNFKTFWKSFKKLGDGLYERLFIDEVETQLMLCFAGACYDDPADLVGPFPFLEFAADLKKTFGELDPFDAFSMLTLVNFVQERTICDELVLQELIKIEKMGSVVFALIADMVHGKFEQLESTDLWASLYSNLIKFLSKSGDEELEEIERVKASLTRALDYLNKIIEELKKQ